MKKFYLWLPDGKCIMVKGQNYDDLLSNIDIVVDKIKESTTYYLGCNDDTIIEELLEEEVNIDVDALDKL